MEGEISKMGYNWNAIEKMGKDRNVWRTVVRGPCPAKG